MRRLLLLLTFMLVTRAAAAATFEEARAAEERYAFAEALALYDRAPSGAERAAWIRARSEGDFEPLAQLERARREPSADLQRLVIAADAYPPGLVRAEAWAFAADTYARRGRAEEAIPLWRKAARDPHADAVLAHAAIRSAVRAHLAAGDVDAAKADLGWLHDDGAARDIDRIVWRHRLHIASIAIIALVFAAAARRFKVSRAGVKLALAFAGFVALAGAALARGYDGASAAPFLWFGAALVPLLIAARAWKSGPPRAVRAVACALSVIAAAFLVLEHTGHLDGLGL
jgi:tetratricopeptide (TPR) repeat protein